MEKEKLKEMLMEAYEAGFRGCLELKEAYVEEMLEQPEPEIKESENQLEFNYDMDTITIQTLGEGSEFSVTLESTGAAPQEPLLANSWRDSNVELV